MVTGAARGQGAAEAEALTRQGARVIPTAVRPEGDCRRLDVTSEQAWADLAAGLREPYGQVHGLVDNAGITWRARVGEVPDGAHRQGRLPEDPRGVQPATHRRGVRPPRHHRPGRP